MVRPFPGLSSHEDITKWLSLTFMRVHACPSLHLFALSPTWRSSPRVYRLSRHIFIFSRTNHCVYTAIFECTQTHHRMRVFVHVHTHIHTLNFEQYSYSSLTCTMLCVNVHFRSLLGYSCVLVTGTLVSMMKLSQEANQSRQKFKSFFQNTSFVPFRDVTLRALSLPSSIQGSAC